MDDSSFDSQDHGDGEGDEVYMFAAVAILHVVGIFALWCFCRICCGCDCCDYCCRRKEPEAEDGSDTVPVIQRHHLQAKKRVSTSYMLLFVAGAVGAHHFYLDRVAHGILAAWTFNLFGFGWLLDLLFIPCYVRTYNTRRTAPDAPYDSSRARACCKIPLLFIAAILSGAGFFLFCPTVLNRVGVLDIDLLRAGTQVNPYDTLGISRKATLSEAKSAYRKESLLWHPDKNTGCGKKCDDKMAEITKAFDLIKKRKGAWQSEVTWEEYFHQYLRDIGDDWIRIVEAFASGDSEKPDNKQEKPQRKNKPRKARDPRDL